MPDGVAEPVIAKKIASENIRMRRRRAGVSLVSGFGFYAAMGFLILLVAAAILAPWIAPFDPLQGDVLGHLAPPSFDASEGPPHLLGTDMLGRDVLSGILYGARISLIVGIASVIGAGIVGSAFGTISGYFRGVVDECLMRLVDIQLAFPFILLAIIIMYVLGQGLWNVVSVLVIASWPIYARVARAEAMRLREAEFVVAAQALGADHWRILTRHIFPNTIAPLLVIATTAVPQMIIFEAALSFLGIGLPPDQISWGSLLAAGRDYLQQAWWIATFPGIAIMLTILSVNVLGGRLQHRLDPRAMQR